MLLGPCKRNERSAAGFSLSKLDSIDIDANNIGFQKLKIADGPTCVVFDIAEVFSKAGGSCRYHLCWPR